MFSCGGGVWQVLKKLEHTITTEDTVIDNKIHVVSVSRPGTGTLKFLGFSK